MKRRAGRGRGAVIWLVGCMCLLPATAGAYPTDRPPTDPYGAGMAHADELEAAGQPGEAADILAPLLGTYPQDFPLWLRLAWLRFQAGRWASAEQAYQGALALNPSSPQALLGRGWCRQRLGDRAGARTDFRAVLAQLPEDASAREGLALVAPEAALWPSLWGTGLVYGAHPEKRSGWGLTLHAPALWALGSGHLLTAASYRLLRFSLRKGNGPASAWRKGLLQHEGYTTLGWLAGRWDLLAHYAYLTAGADAGSGGHVVGGTLGLTTYGRARLEASHSLYETGGVTRAALAWRLPLGEHLRLQPEIAWQWAGQASRWSGALDAAFRVARVTLGVGGRYGDELRPAYLGEAVVWNSDERLLAGARASLDVTLGAGVSLGVASQWRRLERASGAERVQADLWVGSLGLTWQSGEEAW